MRIVMLLVLLWAVASLATSANAAVNVGDHPQLNYKDAGSGGAVSLDRLKGKIVMVDFWATWCGPCMAEAGHMVEINKKYGSEGLQILGVSLDNDAGQMATVAKEKGFTWPQYVDATRKVSQDWGVSGIPHTFLIGPDGTVLWAGHPAVIDPELEKAFKEHPPQLVDPKALADANAGLDKVGQAIDGKDARLAIRLMGKVSTAAKADKVFAGRYDDVQKKLGETADAMLAEADGQVEKADYTGAAAKLKALSDSLAGLPAGATARKKLAALSAKPEAHAAIVAAEKEAKSAELLAVAQKLQGEKKDALAYPRFKELATGYPDTASGKTAAEAVTAYEADAKFMQQYKDTAISGKARGTLSMAQSYRKAGNLEQARKKYQSVIDEFPDSAYAQTARRELGELDK